MTPKKVKKHFSKFKRNWKRVLKKAALKIVENPQDFSIGSILVPLIKKLQMNN